MPLTAKGKKILKKMTSKAQYGVKKGTEIFYAMIEEGKLTGVEKKGNSKPKKKKK